MKTIKTLSACMLLVIFLINCSSCVVALKTNNGQHRGWSHAPGPSHHMEHHEHSEHKHSK